MSAVRTIERDDTKSNLRVIARLNGKARCSVEVWTLHPAASLKLDTINLSNDRQRVRLIESLPLEYRAPAEPLVLAVALEAAAGLVGGVAPDQSPQSSTTPEPASWPDPVDLDTLLNEIVALIRDHVILTASEARALALWLVHTHCLSATDYTPYIWVRSATHGCGKTTLLEILARLARKSKMLLGISPAYLFRAIEKHCYTLILDEVDQQFHGEQLSTILSIVNSGFKRGQTVGRVEKGPDGAFEEKEFHVFCPKAFGGIGRRTLPDQTASRTLRIDLRKATPEETEKLPRPSDAELDALCAPYHGQIARWAADHVAKLAEQRPKIPPELRGRPADVTRPLLAIADMAGDKWSDAAREALIALYKKPSADNTNVRIALLRDCAILFEEKGDDFVPTKEAVSWLNAREDGPWSELNHGHGLTGKRLADLLGDFDIEPDKHRGRNNQRGYFKRDFAATWAAYPPNDSAAPIPSAPSAPSANSKEAIELDGSTSLRSSAPDVLRSGSGADRAPKVLPHKPMPHKEMADGALGAPGTGALDAQYLLDEQLAFRDSRSGTTTSDTADDI